MVGRAQRHRRAEAQEHHRRLVSAAPCASGLSHAERAANRAILRKVLADGASEADAIASLSPEEKGFAKSKRPKAERKSKLIKTELLR